jgi:hypothetical protein
VWDEQTRERVRTEIGMIDHLFVVYADLLEQAQQAEVDLVQKTALASVLHSFYSGIETIFLAIAKAVDHQVPSGARWHQELLGSMSQNTSNRPAVLMEETVRHLAEYLSFRHFYRHSYSFLLEEEKMEKLVCNMRHVWTKVRAEIGSFLDY